MKKPLRNSWLAFVTVLALSSAALSAETLTTLEYKVVGVSLDVTPAALSVPKGIAGSISAKLSGGAVPPAGSFLEATLRGPSFPARRLVGDPNKALLLPPLNLVGDYQLDGVRLVDGASGATLFEGVPASVPVKIFDEVLVSRVTSRPLTLDEIRDKGIVIDEQNFRAVEFEVGFVLDGKTIPVKFPVVAPTAVNNTEVIPAAELEERLKQAEAINDELSQGVVFPPELETAKLDVQVKGINFQFVDEGDGADLGLKIPPIPALMVIPGNIGFLNQFFSVMIFTENGAPADSALTATDITAELILPTGPDRVAGTYAQPGDDPLRFARVGTGAVIQPVQPVRQPGADGKLGTADDVARLRPGETGQGEFLVEGLQEGLHVMDLKLHATLEGLAAGPVEIEGRAAGSVLVRNPKFSLAFAHPRTVRAGEPYEAFVTILNTSQTPANLVSVTLNSLSISGGVLESDETVELGTILPGQTATAKFRIRAQRTGAITFSNLTTSDDSLVGRFRLHAGVDERGVALSPDTLVLPSFVDELPADLLAAANRVLGQALSVAKAGQTPTGVLRVSTGFLKQKAVELAEAGQRVRYGEALARVLPDLLLDWQGARDFGDGWDQILRETNAGLEWRQALARAIENASVGFATSRLLDAAHEFAGRGEAWFLGAVSVGDFQNEPPSANELNLVKSPTERATLDKSTLVKALGYPGHAGAWLASADAGKFEWRFATAETAQFQVNVVLVRANGTATELLWRLDNIAAGACLSYDSVNAGTTLDIDDNCDGTVDRTLAAQRTDFTELPPTVLAVRQDPEVLVGRPLKPCFNPTTTNDANDPVPVLNYANVLAVLFSKPMTQSLANVPAAYALDSGNEAAFVQVQPGGRLALVTMREPVGNLVPRMMSVASTVTDARGNALASAPVAVHSRLVEGVTVRGRVIRADGSFSAGVPVTLTYYDEVEAGLGGCEPFIVRSSQIFTDAEGEFQFDFVLSGIPYSVSATDTSGLSPDVIAALLESTHADALDRARLLELADSPSVRNTLLAEFAVGALPQAIAKAEGLDRALVRDLVESGSPREGTTAVYALRFRGRGTVSGTVFESDGVTPVNNVAVNLFPDPGSRELGRGVFSDTNGRFAFFGVPLGVFSIEAKSSSGLMRVVSDVLTTAGEAKDLAIVLSASAPVLTDLQGRVTEPDGADHSGAQVFVGRFDPVTGKFGNVVATATSDSDGYWHATGVPVNTYDLVAISADGKRKGERRDVVAVAGAVNTVNLTLQARATVTGRVETSTGIPVANALVGGGEALVHTNASGQFTLTGVPTGQRSIVAALERDPAGGIDFPRTGETSVNVIPGAENFVIVRLQSAARIIGRVLDAAGNPVPNIDIAIPQDGGFLWVYADAQGNFEFAGLKLGKHDLSSPAPPHEDPFNGEAAARSLTTASTDEILATIGEAFAAFTGVNNPLLNGEGATFNPLDWGFTKDVTLGFDGQTVIADVRFLGRSTIGGIVKNGQGVPIGARVRLTGIGPSLTGAPTTVIRGERDSDPAIGTASFDGQALVGDWGLQAASPFFPIVISAAGRTTSIAPDDTDNVLQFPAVSETNGSFSGIVLQPDGVTPAGANIKVQISFGPDFIIRTDANGHFATQAGTFTLPAINSEGRPGVGYTVTATDESNGAVGRSTVIVLPAQDNQVTVRLLGRGTAIVTVVRADNSPAEGAAVEIRGGAFPNERLAGTTDAAGQIPFLNLFEGPYGACASLGTGLARIAGRVNLNVPPGATASATLVLAGTGSVSGRFFAHDGVTPIAFANVALGALAFNSTDADGRFDFPDVPLGTYRVLATDAVTGRTGFANVTLSFNGQALAVNITETALGEVFGRVVNALGNGNVPNAQVTLNHSDAFVPARTVTTGPDGAFRFPGTPAGALTINAEDPLTHGRGSASATLPENVATFEVNVALAPVANLTVTVFEPDGTTPATLATVQIPFGNATLAPDTNAQGMARFGNLPLSAEPYRITAESRAVGFTRRWAGAFKLLASQGAEETQSLTLRGVGTVTGTVFQADGTTPAGGAQVTLTIGNEEITVPGGKLSKPSAGEVENFIASAQGVFTFTNIPVGDVRLTAIAQSLGASENATVASDGQIVMRNLTLTASGTVTGRIVRADGATPAAGTDVLLTFMSQSGLPGRVNARTLADGLFSLGPVPVGAFHAEITNPDVGGIAKRDASVSANNETVNLGDITLDEAFPAVTQVTPPDTATGVSTGTTVELLFSEALTPASVETSGIFIRRTDNGALIAATLALTAPAGETALRLVRLVPLTPLVSEKTYQIVVVDGDLVNATGSITNRGPRDLVERPLAALFTATFTTRDDTPPSVLSFTPENGAEQVDVRSVVRLSFDEAIQAGASITLTGPAGAIAGTTTLGVNGLVLVFTPTADLAPNALFTATVSGVRDIAGNFATGQPLAHSFATLDTFAPAVTDIVLENNAPAIAGSFVTLQAVVPAPEAQMRVRFTADFALIGDTAVNSVELPFTLPAQGAVTIRAMTIDRFGNQGPVFEKTFSVVQNQPPTLTFTRVNPLTGPVPTGGPFSVKVSASDDSGVTELRAAVTGAAVVPVQVTGGADITLSGSVRPDAGPAEQIVVLAQAKDTSGVSTGEQQFLIPISDATPPTVQFSGPAPSGFFAPGADVPISVRGRDAFGVARYTVTVSGAFTGTFNTDVTPASADDTRMLLVHVPPNVPANGAAFALAVRARDAAGNLSASLVANVRVSDLIPPQVLAVNPPDGATNVSTRPTVMLTFNENLAPANVNATTLRIERASDNAISPSAVALSADGLTAIVTPLAPLDPLISYRVVATTGITDVSGNALAAQFASTFTTSDFRFTSPVAGSQAVEGQTVQLTIAPANFAAARVRFFVNNVALLEEDTSAPFTSPAIVPPLAQVPGGTLAIRADALDATSMLIATAQVSIIVRGVNEDSDGDTLLNGAEIAAGSDPFRADANEDPDNDGLTNAQEIARGTKANDPDTDHDGLNDGAEVAANTDPLNPDTDGDGLKDGAEAQFGANPLLADTDGDGLNDGFEVGIGRYSIISGSFTFAQAQADAISRGGHLVTITSALEQAAIETVLGGAPTNGWIGLTDQFIENAFRWVTGEPSNFQRFGPGEPNNVGDEDGVQLRSDGLWNDAPLTSQLGYVLEIGFFTSPGLADTDGDGIPDNVDTFPGQQNRAPLADSENFQVPPGISSGIAVADLLTGDTDPDGDPLAVFSVTQPQNGSAALAGANVIYTPNPGFSGGDSFTYTITDPSGAMATANVGIVVGTNNRPVAGPAGIPSTALIFDGVDDQMLVSAYVQGVADTFTIEFWAKPTGTRVAQSESTSGASATSGQRYAIYPVHGSAFGDQFVHAGVGVSVGTNGVSVGEHGAFYAPCVLNFDVALTDWTHIAVVYDNRVPRLYLNGTLVRTGLSGPRITHPGTPISEFLPFGAYQGTLDEIRVWSVALSEAQIASRMLSRVDPASAGLVAYFPFDENVGDMTDDLSLTNATGTLRSNGTPLTTAWVPSDGPLRDFGQTLATTEDTAAVIALTGSDPDGDPITFHVTTLPLHGKLYRSQGNGTFHNQPNLSTVPAAVAGPFSANELIYEPDPQFNGADEFKFIVNDGQLDSVPARVRITVSSVADAPIVQNDTFQSTQGIVFITPSVLSNDSDPDGDAISVGQFDATTTNGGTVASNGDGTFTYTPTPAFFGDDTFTYRATDGTNLSTPATVTIQLAQSNTRVWTNVNGGNWSNPANWLNGLLPGPDDIADITLAGTYTVTLDVDPTISQLVMGNVSGTQTLNVSNRAMTIRHAANTSAGAVVSLPSGTLMVNGPASFVNLAQSGGILRGTGTVTVTGTFSWTGGLMIDAGKTLIAATATGTISGGNNKSLEANRVLENAGMLVASGGVVFFNLNGNGSGAVINNLAGATFEAQGEVDFSHNSATNSAINNAGIFRKTGGGETVLSSVIVALNNTGTVEIVEGTLRLDGGGSLGGAFNVLAAGALNLNNGSFVIPAGSTLAGAGVLTLTGGSATFAETLAFSSAVTISSGTWAFNADQTFTSLTISGGLLRGTGTVTVTGTFSWTGGSMIDAGKTLIAATATGTISGGNNKSLEANRVLENAGMLVASGGTVFFNLNGNGSGAVINNLVGATFEVQGEVDFSHNSATNSAINNAGIFRKTGGGETVLSSVIVALNNTGTVEIVEGTLRLDGGGSNSGTITSTVSGTLDHRGGTFVHAAGATVNLQGALTSSGGTTTFTDPATALGTLTVTGGDMTFGQALTNGADLLITGGAVRFNANESFVTLTQSGGILRGTGTVTVTGTFSWTGGLMIDAGKTLIAATATGTISGGNNKSLEANRVLENAGMLVASGGVVFFNLNGNGSGAVINNLAGATFEAQGEVDFSHNSATNSAINNAGIFRKTGGGETVLSSVIVALNNTGTVEIVEGTLRLDGGGSLGGAFNVLAAGALNLNNGSFVIPAGSTLAGAGVLTLTGGSATFAETLAFSSAVTISSGTWAFNADQTFTSLTISGGLLRGTGTVTVTGTFSWTGGSMIDAGKTLIAATATGTISGGNNKSLEANRVLENAGMLVASGGTVFFNLNGNGSGAVINNLVGATFEVQGEVDFSHNSATNSAINNAGIFRKTGGGETVLSSVIVALNNTGTVEIVEGALRLDGGGSLGGTFDVQAAGALNLNGGTFAVPAGTTVNIAGAIALTGGAGTIETSFGVTTGTVSLGGGSWNFTADQTFPRFTESGGTLRGTATVTVTGTFSWTGGLMVDAGKTLIAATATGTISGGANKSLEANRVLENAGTLLASGGTVFFNLNGNGSGAVINNLAGATFEAQGEVDFSHNSGTNSAINNAGIFRKTGGGETKFTSATVTLNNTGTVEIIEGTLRLEGGFSQTDAVAEMRLLGGELSAPGTLTFAAGRIVGAGTISANVTNAGVIAPSGTPIGTITISGNYTQTAAGRVEFTLAGDPASGLFDQLAITGAATFDGTLRVSSAQPRTAEVFPLVTFASRSGIFAAVEDANGGTAIANYLAARVDVTLTTLGGPAQAPAGLFTRIAEPGGVDTDGDGESDSAEAVAGTDPNDALSRPRIRTVTLRGDNVILRFATSRGRGYLLEACDDLAIGRWRVQGESFMGSGEEMIGLDAGGAKSSQRFYRLRVGAATSPVSGFLRVPLARQTPLGIPFQALPVAAGRLTSANGATLSDAFAAWPVRQWTRRPFVARITSGGIERQVSIVANSANTFTLEAAPFVAARPGDYYEIAPSLTLGGLIGSKADFAQFAVDGRWQTFRRDGALWRSALGSVANRLPLDPGSGLILSRHSTTPAEIVFTGEVPLRPQQLALFAPGVGLAANRFPTALPLNNLQLAPAWRSSSRAGAADVVRAWLDGRWLSFYFDGAHWRSPGSPVMWDNTSVPAGGALLFHRRTEAPPATFTQDPP